MPAPASQARLAPASAPSTPRAAPRCRATPAPGDPVAPDRATILPVSALPATTPTMPAAALRLPPPAPRAPPSPRGPPAAYSPAPSGPATDPLRVHTPANLPPCASTALACAPTTPTPPARAARHGLGLSTPPPADAHWSLPLRTTRSPPSVHTCARLSAAPATLADAGSPRMASAQNRYAG